MPFLIWFGNLPAKRCHKSCLPITGDIYTERMDWGRKTDATEWEIKARNKYVSTYNVYLSDNNFPCLSFTTLVLHNIPKVFQTFAIQPPDLCLNIKVYTREVWRNSGDIYVYPLLLHSEFIRSSLVLVTGVSQQDRLPSPTNHGSSCSAYVLIYRIITVILYL